MNAEKKFTLLSVRVKYLKEEHRVTTEIFNDASRSFSGEFLLKIKHSGSAPSPASNQEVAGKDSSAPPDNDSSIDHTKDDDLKKIYRKIATDSHPDKTIDKSDFEKKYKAQLFEKARQSYEEGDYCTLSELAKELGFEPPRPTKKHVKMAKSTIVKLEKDIKKMKNTYAWVWYNEEVKEKKDTIMEKYVELYEKNNSRT